MEKVLTIDETHSHMCKFESANDVFEPVGRNIGELYKKAIAKISAAAAVPAPTVTPDNSM